jgi:hypothetical protein
MSCKTRNFLAGLAVVTGLMIAGNVIAAAEDAATELDRVTNFQGTTGLFWMNTAYTVGAGDFRATAMVAYDNVDAVYSYDTATGIVTNYGEALILYAPLSATLGLSDKIEVGVLGKSYTVDYDSSLVSDESGAGDAEGTIKWRFASQTENMPAMAGLLTVIGRTGDKDKPFREVEKFGFKLGLAMSSELLIGNDTPVGFHIELQAVSVDPTDDDSLKQDKYSYINAGIALPISDNNRLVAIAETSSLGNANTDLLGYQQGLITEQVVSTFGVRYTWKYINAGIAASSVDSGVSGQETHRRALATVGIGF